MDVRTNGTFMASYEHIWFHVNIAVAKSDDPSYVFLCANIDILTYGSKSTLQCQVVMNSQMNNTVRKVESKEFVK